ncbi:MAG: class I SAM-dependent methyltransferase [Gammaproteobacteria bacterium]
MAVKTTKAQRADRHRLYQQAVQCVEAEIDFVDKTFRKLRGRTATRMREDFCGTAATSCEWVRRRPGNRAWGVDIDAATLDWGRANNLAALREPARKRVKLLNGDVLKTRPGPVDAVLAMNFSYWIFRERATMRRYFRRVREGLGRDGIFFMDAFGGYDAYRVLRERTRMKGFTYVWRQESFNPIDSTMRCHIDFAFDDGSRLARAFTYEWRVWTLPELREILQEAGFSESRIYWQAWDEKTGEPSDRFYPAETADPDPGWICYIVALK